jgi:hypothetical protein
VKHESFVFLLRMNWMQSILLLGLLFVSGPWAWSQLESTMMCVEVNQAGNASVQWTEANDPSAVFSAYTLHILEPSSGLVLETYVIDTPTDPTNPSFVNTTSNANITELCYFVITEGPEGVFGPSSDTLCSIHLTAEPSLTPGMASLGFNSPRIASAPDLSGGGAPLEVQMEEDPGNWSTITTIADNGGMMTYEYEVEECSGDLNFRVTQSSAYPDCDQKSNQAGSSISDELDPDPPVFNYVTVDSLAQIAVLHWEPSPANDLAGYIVYSCNQGFQTAIDTLPYDATFYVNANSNAETYIESYNIAAFDSCLVNNQPDPGAAGEFCVSSIHLNASRSACSDAASLEWTGGFNTASEITSYTIWATEETPSGSNNWNNSSVLATVDANVNSFVHQGATFGSTFRYEILASAANGSTIRSNQRSLNFSYPGAPEFTSLRRASVADSGGVNVLVDLDPNSQEIHTYVLERKRAIDNEYTDLAAQEGLGGLVLQFDDIEAATSEMSYSYRVRVENYCGDSVGVSNVASTMLLEGISDPQLLSNTILWNTYGDFPGNTSGYRIYRRNQQGAAATLIAEVPAQITLWEDDVSSLLFSPGDFCYLIEAVDTDSGPDGGINYALSNERCLTQTPVLWVPNAILIGGNNDVFLPVISFADFDQYFMKIQNRWGEVIFTSEQIGYGWDGMLSGVPAPEGSYAYFISIRDGAGRVYDQTGLVHLLVGE